MVKVLEFPDPDHDPEFIPDHLASNIFGIADPENIPLVFGI